MNQAVAVGIDAVRGRAGEVGLKLPTTWPVESQLFLAADSGDPQLRMAAVAAIRDRSGAIGLVNVFSGSSKPETQVSALDSLGQLTFHSDPTVKRDAETQLLKLRGIIHSSDPTIARSERAATERFHDLFSQQSHKMPALVATLADTSGCYSQLSSICESSTGAARSMMRCAAQASGITRVSLLAALASTSKPDLADLRREAIQQLGYEGPAGLRALFDSIRPTSAYNPDRTNLVQGEIEERLKSHPSDSAVLKGLNLSQFDNNFVGRIILSLAQTGQVSVADGIMRDTNQMNWIRREAATALCNMTAPTNLTVDQDARRALVPSLRDIAGSNDFSMDLRGSAASLLGCNGLPPDTAAKAALEIVKSGIGPVHTAMQSAARLLSNRKVSWDMGQEIVQTLRAERRSFGPQSGSAAEALRLLGVYGRALSIWEGCTKWAGLLRETATDLAGLVGVKPR